MYLFIAFIEYMSLVNVLLFVCKCALLHAKTAVSVRQPLSHFLLRVQCRILILESEMFPPSLTRKEMSAAFTILVR
jgi:hypothetical protein